MAFVETILRDRADGRGADCVVELSEIETRSLARIIEDLRLVDLTHDGPLRVDVPSDVVGASDQFLVQAWFVALHAHKVQPDGVQNPSRLNEERSIACYDRALDKLY